MPPSAGTRWERVRNIRVFDHGWQTPAKTEQWAFEQSVADLPGSPHSELVCFPWATLIDLLRRGREAQAAIYLDALASLPPRLTLVRATVCQHIYARDMLPWFERLGITDLYWSHAVRSEPMINGIRVHAFPLYPVQAMDAAIHAPRPLSERRYLYSFVGAYEPGLYLTSVREWIFGLPPRGDAHIQATEQWHYERQVYGEQVGGRTLDTGERALLARAGQDYAAVMCDSVFCLCPSGSGPNSIRLWEALGLGCIPVILADTLALPGTDADWDIAVLRVPETRAAVAGLPERLTELAREPARLAAMVEAGQRLWRRYGLHGPSTVLREISDRGRIREWLNRPDKSQE